MHFTPMMGIRLDKVGHAVIVSPTMSVIWSSGRATLPRSHLVKQTGQLSSVEMQAVDAALRSVLGL